MSGVAYLAVAPETILAVGAVVVLMVDVFARPSLRVHGRLVAVTYALGAAAVVLQWREIDSVGESAPFGGAISFGYLPIAFRAILMVVAILGTMAAWELLAGLGRRAAEGIGLILVASAGFMLMSASADLVLTFVALEVGSIALYVLAGIVRDSEAGDEAAMKYFLLGAFASAIFIYGAALIYTATGVTNLNELGAFLTGIHVARPAVLLIGLGLVVVGLGFKVTAAPFHSWAPDVYQGAPAGAVGFMAAAAKVGGFAALLNIVILGFGRFSGAWGDGLALVAALSVAWGALAAIGQSDLRRMLAYSGVSHAGFILCGVVAGVDAVSGIIFYLATYSIMLIGAFTAVGAVSGPSATGSPFESYRGLSRRSPLLAAVLAVLMIAMSGMPLTAGFIGKFMVFTAAWEGGYEWLVVVALLASVIAFFFYLRPVVLMYFGDADGDDAVPVVSPAARWVLILSAGVSLVLGVVPGVLLGVLTRAGV